jgi:hypothetical protein
MSIFSGLLAFGAQSIISQSVVAGGAPPTHGKAPDHVKRKYDRDSIQQKAYLDCIGIWMGRTNIPVYRRDRQLLQVTAETNHSLQEIFCQVSD